MDIMKTKRMILFTKHARDRLLQREINEETVTFVIDHPDYVKKTVEGRYIAVKKIQQVLWNVIYIEEGARLKVITVYSC